MNINQERIHIFMQVQQGELNTAEAARRLRELSSAQPEVSGSALLSSSTRQIRVRRLATSGEVLTEFFVPVSLLGAAERLDSGLSKLLAQVSEAELIAKVAQAGEQEVLRLPDPEQQTEIVLSLH